MNGDGLARGAKVVVLTSGGDAPGMNAALRAVGRVGHARGFAVLGVEEGYKGLIAGRFAPLDLHTLDDAARRGGTILGSARSKEFVTQEGQQRAHAHLIAQKIDAVIVVGGNGSLTGAAVLGTMKSHTGGNLRVAGIPASIDNDLACTSMSIGVDTAMNTIVEACDRIYDTATAHRRTFIVEVMGRDCGYLAMTSAIAASADAVLVRETGKGDDALVEQVLHAIRAAYSDPARRRVLVVKAEGVQYDSMRLKEAVDAALGSDFPDVDTRVTVLGHVVRGGSPSAFDRLLGARLGRVAMLALADGDTGFMTGWLGPGLPTADTRVSAHDPYVVTTPLPLVLDATKTLMSGQSDLAKWRRKVFEETENLMPHIPRG